MIVYRPKPKKFQQLQTPPKKSFYSRLSKHCFAFEKQQILNSSNVSISKHKHNTFRALSVSEFLDILKSLENKLRALVFFHRIRTPDFTEVLKTPGIPVFLTETDFFSTRKQNDSKIEEVLQTDVEAGPCGVSSGSVGTDSAGFGAFFGCGVPLYRLHVVPVTNVNSFIFCLMFNPKSFLDEVYCRIFSVCSQFGLSAELQFQYPHQIFLHHYVSVLRRPPDMFVSEHICRPFRLDVPSSGLPVVSGIFSKSSLSLSSSVSVSVFFRVCTFFSLPLSKSCMILSQRPYFPSSPSGQFLFFGCI